MNVSTPFTAVLCTLLIGAMTPQVSEAQTIDDVLRFSISQPLGTARSQGLGGAMTAVGADYASASINPAGLGLYRGSELQFTGGLNAVRTESTLFGEEEPGYRFNATLPSASLVLSKRWADRKSGFKGITFGMGLNQVNNFSRRVEAQGFNPNNSISTVFAGQANGFFPDQLDGFFVGGLPDPTAPFAQGFNTFTSWDLSGDGTDDFFEGIVNPNYEAAAVGDSTQYVGAFQNGGIAQDYLLQERGRHNEWNFSVAGNYNDRVFVGVGLTVAEVFYDREWSLIETDINNLYNEDPLSAPVQTNTSYANSLEVIDNLRTTGTGIGANFGLLFQPLDEFRLGLSVQTPRILFLKDQFITTMLFTDDDGFTAQTQSAEGFFDDYAIITPVRANLGATIIVGKRGLLTADFELTDYRTAGVRTNFNDPGYDDYVDGLNEFIDDNLALAYALRLGGELKLSNFYLRVGGSYYTAPWDDDLVATTEGLPSGGLQSVTTQRISYGGGIGYRGKRIFADVSFTQSRSEDVIGMYSASASSGLPDEVQLVPNITRNHAVLTVGLKFGGN